MSAEEHYNRGMELFAEGKLDQAMEAYQSALAEQPDHEDALHALAMTYAHQDKIDEAIQTAKRLIEVAPENELAYTSLSMFYQQKGMIAEAEEIGAKARTLGWKRQLADKK
ncbi:MAG TPA: tetratricopeptide repeat protein [Candidatus Binatia bacterium]|jgi:tetratricopeptide (TPR) repeat protein